MRVGVAQRIITPELGTELTFYGPARAVRDHLRCQVLAFEDQGARGFLIALDVLAIRRSLVDRWRHALAKRHGLALEAIMIHCSHTHYGPQVVEGVCPRVGPFQATYVQWLESCVLEAAEVAMADLQETQIRRGRGMAAIGVNRRREEVRGVQFAPYFDGPVDPVVTVVELVRPQSPQVVLFHYACHPTTQTGEEGASSADWPGAARAAIEATDPGAVAIFLQGCCGDIRPATWTAQGQHFRRTDFAEMADLGRCVGREVVRVRASSMHVVQGAFSATEVCVPLPLGPAPTVEDLASASFQARVDWQPWTERRRQDPPWAEQTCLPFHIQRFTMGVGMSLVGFEGEPVLAYSRIVHRWDRDAIAVGYSNGVVTYVPSDRMIGQGGYEVMDAVAVYMQPAPFAEGVEMAVSDGIARVFRPMEPAK